MSPPTALVRSITTCTSRFEERADGLVVQCVLSTRIQTLAEARENNAAFAEIVGGRPRRTLIDMRVVRGLDPGVLDVYADPAAVQGCSAAALLVATTVGRALGGRFVDLRRAMIPLRLFTDEAEAVAWLTTQPD